VSDRPPSNGHHPRSRDELLIEAAEIVLKARDEIQGYRRELFDPGGVMARLSEQMTRLETALNANYSMLRETVQTIRSDVDNQGARITALEGRTGRLEEIHARPAGPAAAE
jgi:hypothetical protein